MKCEPELKGNMAEAQAHLVEGTQVLDAETKAILDEWDKMNDGIENPWDGPRKQTISAELVRRDGKWQDHIGVMLMDGNKYGYGMGASGELPVEIVDALFRSAGAEPRFNAKYRLIIIQDEEEGA
jgi:hypothetical protein